MDTAHANASFSRAFIDELARLGVGDVCLCPGSRSTPLAVALVQHPGLRHWMHLDERAAAFFALGIAKHRRRAVAVLCTSGSAAANFLPAAVEAHYAHVPLLLLTADRPHELRDTGAPQAIDQLRLFGSHAKWFVEMLLPEESELAARYARIVAGRAVATANATPAGPVHLNFPFREPFLPAEGEAAYAPFAASGAPALEVETSPRVADGATLERLAEMVRRARRGLIVCGPQDDPALAPAVANLATVLQFPLLADPLSQARCGTHDRRMVIASYDALMHCAELGRRYTPDLVLRIGPLPTSKALVLFLEAQRQCRHVFVDGSAGWHDTGMLDATVINADPSLLCSQLSVILQGAQPAVETQRWAAAWRQADDIARQTIARRLAGIEGWFEGKVFAELAALLPENTTLFAGNSMPVRDLDGFFPALARPLRLMGNRGGNGIDGVVSSALGAATCGPLVLVIGDLSLYHDSTGLLAARANRINATIVLINNDGGGI